MKSFNKLLIITFITMLSLPMVVQRTGLENYFLKGRKMVLVTPPEIDKNNIKVTLRDFKHYYSNNFGLKITLFELYKNFIQNFFKDDPLPNKVITGLDGWLFVGNSDSNAVSESLGFENFSKSELHSIALNLKSQKEWLNKRNIQYYVSIAPSKLTIYKEYLPFSAIERETKLDALKSFLKKEINFELIDLKEYLIPVKDSVNLFYKHDTHWNEFGAFLGYEKLINVIEKNNSILKTQRILRLDIEENQEINYKVGDLNKLLNNNNIKEKVILFDIIKSENAILSQKKINNSFSEVSKKRYINKNKKLKIIIFRDSFTSAFEKYINETFGECVYIWNHSFDKKLIEFENPDIVLFEVGERVIENLNGK